MSSIQKSKKDFTPSRLYPKFIQDKINRGIQPTEVENRLAETFYRISMRTRKVEPTTKSQEQKWQESCWVLLL